MEAYGLQQGVATALHLAPKRHFLFGMTWNHQRKLTRHQQAKALLTVQALATFAEPAAFHIWRTPSPQEPIHPLTPRELECLSWVCRGMTDELISHLVEISPRTVRKHVESCMRKLSAANRTEAAVTVTRLGIAWHQLPSHG